MNEFWQDKIDFITHVLAMLAATAVAFLAGIGAQALGMTELEGFGILLIALACNVTGLYKSYWFSWEKEDLGYEKQ